MEPYLDDPANSGYLLEMADPPEQMLEMMREATEAGFATAVHAIGDQANTILQDLYSRLFKNDIHHNWRYRVEHAQHLNQNLIEGYAKLGLTVSMQPAHLTEDGCYVNSALGNERAKFAYPCRSLIDAGSKVVFNTDWPVIDLNPLVGLQAAVTRTTADAKNPGGWIPEQRVSVEEAVRAYTSMPAYAMGLENQLGILETGYLADMVLLDTNIFTCGPEEISRAGVKQTWLAGNLVYMEVK
jgi:predicted amidohydrolase YtcJ